MLATAGADRIMSVDLHSGQIQGFFDGPVDHLTAMPVLLDYLRENAPDDLVVVAPDAGRAKVADRYAQHLNADLAIVQKRRDKTGSGARRRVRDGRRDRRPPLRADRRHDRHCRHDRRRRRPAHQARRHRRVGGGHALPAVGPRHRSAEELLDHPPRGHQHRPAAVRSGDLPIIEVLSVAGILADVIKAIFEDQSVSEIFGGENQS